MRYRLQIFKVHSIVNLKVYSINISFESSCSLFLCCYRATGQTFFPPLGVFPQTGVSPGIPSKSIDLSLLFSLIFAPKMTLKMEPKSLKIHSRSHPETNPQKITKIYRTKPLQTLKIELSCTRGASFHIFTISKKNEKVLQTPLKSTPTTTQNP